MHILKICYFIFFTSVFASLSHSATSYGHLIIEDGSSTATLTLDHGDLFEPTATSGDINLSVILPDSRILSIATVSRVHGNFNYGPSSISGPCTVRISGDSGEMVMYKITSPDPAVLSNVVTLSHTSGNWEVQLETSSDLKNWTAVAPGSFSGNPDLQFFRVKATQIQSP